MKSLKSIMIIFLSACTTIFAAPNSDDTNNDDDRDYPGGIIGEIDPADVGDVEPTESCGED